jgi:AcrR family transcriptional regulator
LHTDERRHRLLKLGIKLFSSRSYDGTSIDEVAEMAGVSKGLLYHYFRSKREFFVETVRASSQELQKLSAPDSSLPPEARLRAAIDAHLRYVERHAKVYATLYRGGTNIAREVESVLEEHRAVVMSWFLENLGLSRGIAEPGPALRTALRAWIAMVEGASLNWIAHRELSREDLTELLMTSYIALLNRALEVDASRTTVRRKASRRKGKKRKRSPRA